ncbi:MAG: AAA family ATPase [Pseudomonadota bacterium]
MVDTDGFDAPARGGSASEREHDMIVPRVSIEAFCMTPEFASAVQTASQDRRMAKAKASVGMGGAAAAAKRFANVATPNLIIVESEATGFTVFEELESLASVCDEDTKVIVAGPSNDVTLYRELIRQGVCEYLVTPTSPLQLIEAISTAYEDPEARPAGKTITVFGVRGGVGASVLSHNLAELIASQSERETILIDLDLEFGTVALDFNLDAKNTVTDALSAIDGLDDVKLKRLLFQHTEYLNLLPSPAVTQPRAEATEGHVLGLIDVARSAADYVVIDAPSQWTEGVRCALRQSEKVVLVAAPDLTSLRNLKAVHDWLSAERKHDAAPKIVLNMVGEPKRPEIAAAEFAEIMGAPVDLILPHDPAVFGAAQNDGTSLISMPTARRITEKLEPFVAALRGMEDKTAKKSKGLAAWLGLGAAS